MALFIVCIFVGDHKTLCLLYKLEKSDFYDKGQNLLYKHLTAQNMWLFENCKMILQIKSLFIRYEGFSRILVDLISNHYPVTYFIDIESMDIILKTEKATLQSCDRISNLSLLLFKSIEESTALQQYIHNLSSNLIALLSQKDIVSAKILHQATLHIIILVNALDVLFVREIFDIINITLKRFKIILKTSSTYPVKILEAFINVSLHLNDCFNNTEDSFFRMSYFA